jgi:hypothetical protein
VLQSLAGEPEVLNSVPMLSAGDLNLRGQTAKDISCGSVYWQKRLAGEAAQGGQSSLTRSRVLSDVRTEPKLSEGHGRNEKSVPFG